MEMSIKKIVTVAITMTVLYSLLSPCDGMRCNVCKDDKLTCAKAEDYEMKECHPTTFSCFKFVGHGNTSVDRPVGFQNVPFNGVSRECADPHSVYDLFGSDFYSVLRNSTKGKCLSVNQWMRARVAPLTSRALRGEACVCSGDGCNSGTKSNVHLPAFIAAVLFLHLQ